MNDMGLVNWLKNRLSPVKRDTQRWQELSESIEEFWGAQFDAEYLKTLDLRSIYTADDAGQLRMIAELGEYYELDLPYENRPIVVSMRRLELHQKETDVPVRMMMQRLGVSGVEWLPLYALNGDVYGTKFYTDKQLEAIGITTPGESSFDVSRLDGSWSVKAGGIVKLKKTGTYLTSRARLGVNLLEIVNPDIIPVLKERVAKAKPLHIFFDGMQYWIYLETTVTTSTKYSLYLQKSFNQVYPGNNRMDGSWKIGTNIVNQHYHMNGQWKLDGKNKLGAYLTTGIVHRTLVERKISASGLLTKTLTRPDTYMSPCLGESLLKLDGLWSVGGNRILTLSGQRHMNKVISIAVEAGIHTGTISSSELQYPANPSRLAKVIQLDSRRKLNGAWGIGDATEINTLRVNGGWRLKRTGISTESAGSFIQKQGEISAFTNKLGAAYARLGEGILKLDGAWSVGAYGRLNGGWKLRPGRRLQAPHLSETKWSLDGSWPLSCGGRKLNSSWKLGATTGPSCDAIRIIRKV